MAPYQWVLLIIGVLLVLSNYFDFKKLFSSKVALPVDGGKKPDKVEVPVPEIHIPVAPKPDNGEKRLYKVVKVWEALRGKCVDYGLNNSVSGLDQIFATFIDFVKKEPKTDE